MSAPDVIARYRAAAAKLREMEAAGTPGPWTLNRRSATTCMGNEHAVASTGGYSTNQRDPQELADELEANARLICASRNLLPALLDAGDALAELLDGPFPFHLNCKSRYMKTETERYPCDCRPGVALAALVEALERECGGAR
jgi:hypothetical protein